MLGFDQYLLTSTTPVKSSRGLTAKRSGAERAVQLLLQILYALNGARKKTPLERLAVPKGGGSSEMIYVKGRSK